MISSSKDGEGIYQVMRHFNFKCIRGSSNTQGSKALYETQKLLEKKGKIAISPDGPTGPSMKVKPGIILLARDCKVPIIPWSYYTKSEWNLKTWDKHRIPKPFNFIKGSFGSPILVPSDTSFEKIPNYCLKLEKVMEKMSNDLKNQENL